MRLLPIVRVQCSLNGPETLPLAQHHPHPLPCRIPLLLERHTMRTPLLPLLALPAHHLGAHRTEVGQLCLYTPRIAPECRVEEVGDSSGGGRAWFLLGDDGDDLGWSGLAAAGAGNLEWDLGAERGLVGKVAAGYAKWRRAVVAVTGACADDALGSQGGGGCIGWQDGRWSLQNLRLSLGEFSELENEPYVTRWVSACRRLVHRGTRCEMG